MTEIEHLRKWILSYLGRCLVNEEQFWEHFNSYYSREVEGIRKCLNELLEEGFAQRHPLSSIGNIRITTAGRLQLNAWEMQDEIDRLSERVWDLENREGNE